MRTVQDTMTMAKMPLCSGMPTLGSVTARVTAAQVVTEDKRVNMLTQGSWLSNVNLFDHFIGPCNALHAGFMRLSHLLMQAIDTAKPHYFSSLLLPRCPTRESFSSTSSEGILVRGVVSKSIKGPTWQSTKSSPSA